MATGYDALIIGAGQAGSPLAMRLAGQGMRVALIERKLIGGTCVNTGCTPTKTLVASAQVAHLARRAAEYGVVLGSEVSVDMRRVRARMEAVVARSHDGLKSSLEQTRNLRVVEGHARFVSPDTVAVGDEVLQAGRIFVNVGARAVVPDIPGLDQVPFLTNVSMMRLDTLPSHLVIIGGSVVALEFAQIYRRFGAEVTVLERGSRLIQREDEDVSEAVLQILRAEGIRVELDAGVTRVARAGDGVEVSLAGGGSAAGSHLLVAVGRRPNTDDLGLEAAGLAADAHGVIAVDDQLRTGVAGIWALGDCNGRGAFTHTSYNDYEIVAANLLDGETRRVSDRITTYAMYIDPPLGRVGMTLAEARRSGRRVLVGSRAMDQVARAVEKGETQGFMRVLVDADSKQMLGATILGPGGDEAVHGVLDLMLAGAPCSVLQRAMHIHPTVSELLPTITASLHPL